MERNHRAITEDIRAASEGRPLETVAEQITTAANENAIKRHVNLARSSSGQSSRVREDRTTRPNAIHTLVLIGELDHASTHVLEAEIERLCAVGIKAITLDLSKLSGIDSAGVAVIVFRRRWCGKRGCELALIAGSRPIQRAFELAGVADALPFKESHTVDT